MDDAKIRLCSQWRVGTWNGVLGMETPVEDAVAAAIAAAAAADDDYENSNGDGGGEGGSGRNYCYMQA